MNEDRIQLENKVVVEIEIEELESKWLLPLQLVFLSSHRKALLRS